MTTAAMSPALREEAAGRQLAIAAGFGLFAFAAASGLLLAIGEVDALFVTLALALGVAVLFDFRIGAVALVLVLPSLDITLLPHALFGIIGLNPVNLLLAATLFSFAVRGRLQQAGRFLPPPLAWLYIAPIVAAGALGSRRVNDILPYFYEFLVINFTSAAGYVRDMVIRPMIMVVIALALGAAVARSEKPERFIVPIALSVWLIAALQLGYVAASGVRLGALSSASMRTFFSAIGMHANDLGRLYVVAYALLVFVWWETKNQVLKTFLLATLGVLAFALLITFSRGAFVGFLLVSLVFLAWKFNWKTMSLAVLAAIGAAVVLPGFVYTRVLLGIDTGDVDTVSAGRVEGIWLPLLPEVLRTPPWGNGLGSIMWSYPMQAGAMLTVGHPHNAYLEALLDMGVLGLTMLLAYFWHVWSGLRRLAGDVSLSPELRGFFQGAIAGLAAFFVTGMAGSSLRPMSEFSYLWLAIGMMYGMLARKPAS